MGEPGVWVVTDELLGRGDHDVALRWHAVDGATQFSPVTNSLTVNHPNGRMLLQLQGPKDLKVTLARGEGGTSRPSGWESRYYQERLPRPTLTAQVRATLPFMITTRIFLST